MTMNSSEMAEAQAPIGKRLGRALARHFLFERPELVGVAKAQFVDEDARARVAVGIIDRLIQRA
jgi:hypothetical protein